jgi:alkanesulfonate monooxygenase SsuD/methylene tetrahydromethanopterin reductase-like flavin-dependent oxidoreductase (luciferase family)
MGEHTMTDTAPSPADVVRTVPEGQVVYGMQLPIQSQSTLYVADWEKESGPVELARIARVADEAGFFYLGVCDHTAIPRRLADAMGTTWYDTTATLGWLAAVTTRIHLLSHIYVILAQRHPLRAAKELSTIDRLSGGRVICGVGAGHVTEEFEQMGPELRSRGRPPTRPIVALARGLADEFPVLPGPRFPARDSGLGPRPVRQAPRPPIWAGGSSPAALRRTARVRRRLAPPVPRPQRGAGGRPAAHAGGVP